MDYLKYENTLPFPSRPSRRCKCNTLNSEKHKCCSNCGETLTYKDKIVDYNKLRTEYSIETNRLHDVFKTDALDYVGATGHSKADRLFDIAWENGHGNGLREVLYEMGKLVELLD